MKLYDTVRILTSISLAMILDNVVLPNPGAKKAIHDLMVHEKFSRFNKYF